MKLSTNKYHLLTFGSKCEKMKTNIEKVVMLNFWMLQLKVDLILSHIDSICLKANQKLSVLCRLVKLLSFDKKRLLFKTAFESQLKYCPLVWMFCSRK